MANYPGIHLNETLIKANTHLPHWSPLSPASIETDGKQQVLELCLSWIFVILVDFSGQPVFWGVAVSARIKLPVAEGC